jgi:hypothetical protein
VVEAEAACRDAARALDAARSDHDRETLGRVYDSAVGRFDQQVFDLYEIASADLTVIRSS